MVDGKIVTIDFGKRNVSNTYIVKKVIGSTCYLFHPLFPECLIEKDLEELDKVSSHIKDSVEKCLDFAKSNTWSLDPNSVKDLESLCLYFVVRRQLTPRQKNILSNICGLIASSNFNDDIEETMQFIVKNDVILDDFNRMWYNNFKGLFTGKQLITSKKQRDSIFNMAGFIMAELENPKANK